MSRHLNFHPLGLCKGTQQQFKAWEIYTWISLGFLNVELNATSVQTNEKKKQKYIFYVYTKFCICTPTYKLQVVAEEYCATHYPIIIYNATSCTDGQILARIKFV